MAVSDDALFTAAIDIADAVFPFDYRGLRTVARRLPADAYLRAARAVLARPGGTALLVTGFPAGTAGETDGPPGTRAVGEALHALGWQIVTAACPGTIGAVAPLLGALGPVESIDGTTSALARAGCERVLGAYAPDLAIAIERPGVTADGHLVNMHGRAIDAVATPLDALMAVPLSIAIADGGNEIGMGTIARHLAEHHLVPAPAVTRTTHLLLASVSNWGAYGLVAMLDILTGIRATPNPKDDQHWLQTIVDAGAIDGVTGQAEASVDTFAADRTATVLNRLHEIRARCAPLPIGDRAP